MGWTERKKGGVSPSGKASEVQRAKVRLGELEVTCGERVGPWSAAPPSFKAHALRRQVATWADWEELIRLRGVLRESRLHLCCLTLGKAVAKARGVEGKRLRKRLAEELDKVSGQGQGQGPSGGGGGAAEGIRRRLAYVGLGDAEGGPGGVVLEAARRHWTSTPGSGMNAKEGGGREGRKQESSASARGACAAAAQGLMPDVEKCSTVGQVLRQRGVMEALDSGDIEMRNKYWTEYSENPFVEGGVLVSGGAGAGAVRGGKDAGAVREGGGSESVSVSAPSSSISPSPRSPLLHPRGVYSARSHMEASDEDDGGLSDSAGSGGGGEEGGAWDDSASDDSGAIDFAEEALGMGDESSEDDDAELVGLSSGVRKAPMMMRARDSESDSEEEFRREQREEKKKEKEEEKKKEKKKKKKNRMGQRERQKLLEQQYGREAKHVKRKLRREGKERKEKRKRKERGEEGEGGGEPKARKKGRHEDVTTQRGGKPSGPHHAQTPDGEAVHPSWAAAQERKRKQREMEKTAFAGKKITFD